MNYAVALCYQRHQATNQINPAKITFSACQVSIANRSISSRPNSNNRVSHSRAVTSIPRGRARGQRILRRLKKKQEQVRRVSGGVGRCEYLTRSAAAGVHDCVKSASPLAVSNTAKSLLLRPAPVPASLASASASSRSLRIASSRRTAASISTASVLPASVSTTTTTTTTSSSSSPSAPAEAISDAGGGTARHSRRRGCSRCVHAATGGATRTRTAAARDGRRRSEGVAPAAAGDAAGGAHMPARPLEAGGKEGGQGGKGSRNGSFCDGGYEMEKFPIESFSRPLLLYAPPRIKGLFGWNPEKLPGVFTCLGAACTQLQHCLARQKLESRRRLVDGLKFSLGW